MPKLVVGNELGARAREQVLSAFIYRWTSDSPYRETVYATIGSPSIPLVTDEEWLSQHAFNVNKDGSLSLRSLWASPAFFAQRGEAEQLASVSREA